LERAGVIGNTVVMACEEKLRLVAGYESATKKFAAAVTELQEKMGTSPRVEYDRLQRLSDQARNKSEQSRLALEQHVTSHGC
jgi:hypothetical protein